MSVTTYAATGIITAATGRVATQGINLPLAASSSSITARCRNTMMPTRPGTPVEQHTDCQFAPPRANENRHDAEEPTELNDMHFGEHPRRMRKPRAQTPHCVENELLL